ncbi:unnamed protein product [Cuscuta campestris]|uniref:Uncharacterized protein n=1 Tax=Cuscuta campestris TaxID=132261 RepID=A0A484KUB0_9ASTE|nr:unnamed protein product [Cuscuta campestris]
MLVSAWVNASEYPIVGVCAVEDSVDEIIKELQTFRQIEDQPKYDSEDQDFEKEIFIDPVSVPDDDLIIDPIDVVPVTVADIVVDVSRDNQRDHTVQAEYSRDGVIFYGCTETFGMSESDVVVLYDYGDVTRALIWKLDILIGNARDKHTQLIEKSEGKHSVDLKEISKSVQKTLEIISLLSETVSNTMEIYASDSQLQLKEINKVKEQIASVTVSLPKQISLLQMDIRSALAVASANQVVTKDYLKVIIDNQKEAYKLFRLIGANSGNRKMEVILQQHSPSPIPQLPITVKEGEVSYIPSHLNLTNLILEAQQRNPENSAQLLSSSGLDGTEFIGTVVDHFSNDAQSEERRENLRRIKELCGNMKGISEVAGSPKRKKTEGSFHQNRGKVCENMKGISEVAGSSTIFLIMLNYAYLKYDSENFF